jgi:hypothetical protein
MSSTHYECDTKEFARRILASSGSQSREAVSAKAEVAQKSIQLLAAEPEGLRHSVLLERLKAELPGIPFNTVRGTVVALAEYKPEDIYKPAKGLFQHVKYRDTARSATAECPALTLSIREEDFYASFAEYLVEDLEECTKCIALGGAVFQDKWGTPDVIGVRKPRESDIVKLPTEIVAAEIKLDTRNLITAFGQAASYRLFSHRCYLVVPTSSSAEDLARLESLCVAVGLGLVLFDSDNPLSPDFVLRSRAAKNEPDAFYMNRNLRIIEDRLFG